jgi:hypothetical protein
MKVIRGFSHRAPRRRGAPQQQNRRGALLAAIYHIRCCSDKVSVHSFAHNITKFVTITYARTLRKVKAAEIAQDAFRGLKRVPNYKQQKASGIAQDVSRGLLPTNEKLLNEMIYALFWWRIHHVNSAWGFYVGGMPMIILKPIGPQLVKWIDDAIDAALKSPDAADLRLGFHDLLRKAPQSQQK